MKGKQWIKIESRYVTYDIKINRNITVITRERYWKNIIKESTTAIY